jgi:superoxide oxidase
MLVKNSADRYSSLTVGLHWMIFLLLVAVYACMELRGFAEKGSALRNGMSALHFMLGLSVLLLVVLRLASRAVGGPAPGIRPPLPLWQARSAAVLHVLLYAFMIAMPLLGWLTLSAGGKPIPFFGAVLPPLLGTNVELSRQIKEVHETLATVGYFLIGVHAAAGLAHRYLFKDNTLARMLPWASRP